MELAQDAGTTPSFPIPTMLRTRVTTKETFGIIPMPQALVTKLGMHTVPKPAVEGVPYFHNSPVHLLTRLSTARVTDYEYLKHCQRTEHAVAPIHTSTEFQLFRELMQSGKFSIHSTRAPAAQHTNVAVNFDALALHWNQTVHARALSDDLRLAPIFYKIPEQLERHHKVWAAYRGEQATLSLSSAQRQPITSILEHPSRRASVLPSLSLPNPLARSTSQLQKGKGKASASGEENVLKRKYVPPPGTFQFTSVR